MTSPERWPRSGFRRYAVALMPVTDALSAVLAGAEALPEEMVALDAAYHRVLARDVPSLRTQPPQALSAMDGYAARAAGHGACLRTQPPQAMSAMDGYAVRAADAAVAGARLKLIGEVAAGRPF